MRDEDTSTSLELFETSNTQEVKTQPQKVETCSTASETSSSRQRKLPRRWMPTMTPRMRETPTISVAMKWEMRAASEGLRMLQDLEEMLRAATLYSPGLPGWSVNWQLSRDPRAGFRVGLVLWMQPEQPLRER